MGTRHLVIGPLEAVLERERELIALGMTKAKSAALRAPDQYYLGPEEMSAHPEVRFRLVWDSEDLIWV